MATAQGELAVAEGSTESSKETTLTEDCLPPQALIKHPLQNTWTLWFFRNNQNRTWEQNLCEITSFDTVEDFWALYNHIELVSRLGIGCDYCLFKQGTKPMWEDDRNKHGGRWLISLSKSQREIDWFWLETLLCLIGEAFDEVGDEICGCVINVRRGGTKISVWTRDAQKEEYNKKIGRVLKERLNMINQTIPYEAHQDTMSKTGSTAKNRYHV
ncbi:Eukaryotic translation initiation factor 4E type 2 [Chamberlinius hualienensis]